MEKPFHNLGASDGSDQTSSAQSDQSLCYLHNALMDPTLPKVTSVILNRCTDWSVSLLVVDRVAGDSIHIINCLTG